MPRHPARHRMNGEFYFLPLLLKLIGKLFDQLLRLREGHSIAGHDDHLFCIMQPLARLLNRRFRYFFRAGRRCLRLICIELIAKRLECILCIAQQELTPSFLW